MISVVWSTFGHRFMGTDNEEHESCLTCGALFQLLAQPDDATCGDYSAADGSDPMQCTGDTSMAHGYAGERVCDACNGQGCEHCNHECNCLLCA